MQIYSFFREDELKRLFNSNWLIIFYVIPLFIAFSVATLSKKEEEQAETLDQHNRRVMLNHVENFWVKGILEKSLHGAALLELGIKEDSTAITYPWTIKRESTNETLPAGKSILGIFNEIGAGRSLLILGAPGSGKTTMLIELARQLIESARNDEAEPIPVVFNLASWTEKQTLADWLASQLNIVYYVPRKTAPKWVSENKMILLLDGLDEVKQESRAKCVTAINQFRTENGLTALVVCSRIEEYTAINIKLSFEGAIELQPLTTKQVNDYFDRLGKSLAGVKQLLKKDKTLRELAATPLMLSIMTLAYKDKEPEELPTSSDKGKQRKHLFDTYINRMFERTTRMSSFPFTKKQTLHYLGWLARKMIQHNIFTYQIETMQPSWLEKRYQHLLYRLILGLIDSLVSALFLGLFFEQVLELISGQNINPIYWLVASILMAIGIEDANEIKMTDRLTLSWKKSRVELIIALPVALIVGLIFWMGNGLNIGLSAGLIFGFLIMLNEMHSGEQVDVTIRPGQRLKRTLANAFIATVLASLISWLIVGVLVGPIFGIVVGLFVGLICWIGFGSPAFHRHYVLRFILTKTGFLPRQILSFWLNYEMSESGRLRRWNFRLQTSSVQKPVKSGSWNIFIRQD